MTRQMANKAPTFRQRPRPLTSNVASAPGAQPGYTVGRGKPPVEHRFKPGQSGNPKGRPKGARGLNTMVRELMEKKIAVRTPKGSRKIPHIEALLLKLLEAALKGDQRAIERCLAHYAAAMPKDASPGAEPQAEEALSAVDELILANFLASQSAANSPNAGGSHE